MRTEAEVRAVLSQVENVTSEFKAGQEPDFDGRYLLCLCVMSTVLLWVLGGPADKIERLLSPHRVGGTDE